MTGSGLYEDPNLARFYDLPGQARANFDYVEARVASGQRVLDLGCGTGALAARLARKCDVVATDSAEAMLSIARTREGADSVTWLRGDARTLRLRSQFDWVVMTGHTFQVFLSGADQVSVLRTVRAHLAPGGRFLFDTRNPACPDRKERGRDETFERVHDPRLGEVERWNVSSYDDGSGILTYTNGYRVLETGTVHEASEKIRYTSQADLAARISAAGLRVTGWLGEWDGTGFAPQSREIIPVGEPA